MTNVPRYTPVFIGACPRSGTTFLGDRLGALLNGRVTPESQFKAGVIDALQTDGPEAAIARLNSDWVYRNWRDRPEKKELKTALTAQNFFERLVFPSGVDKDRQPYWIDHTPSNFLDFAMLRSTFPNARFINLQRDGRAVFASVRKLSWGPNNPIDAAIWWQAQSAAGLAASQLWPDICITVRYEDLVRGDMDNWTRLVRFLTGDETRMVVAENLAAASGFDLPAFTRGQHKLVGSSPESDRAEAWRHELPARLVEIFEANAGALLDALGYERVTRHPRQAGRSERLRMGEWPVRIRAKPFNRLAMAIRKKRIGIIGWK